MTPFSSLAVTATIMLLMVAQNCHCEKNVHAKEKKVQTPGLWSALGCMITDDITKCVRDSATDTSDKKDKADVSDDELSASSDDDDDDDSPGFFDAISTFMTDGIFRFFEDDEDKKQETGSHNDVEDHSDDDYDSNDSDDEKDDDTHDGNDDDDDDDDDNDDSDEDLDAADNFVSTSNRTTSTAEKGKIKRSVSEAEESRKRRKEDKMMKLMMLGMILKSKFSAIAAVFGTFMQLKFFALSLMNLLLGLVRLYMDFTRKEPQKVIYYEQAHHQHTYDQQYEDKEWLGGWLSKKDDTVSRNINGDPHSMAYSGQKPST